MYLFFIFLLSIFLINTTNESDINVGTILFTKSDLYKPCWNKDSIALLTSRMIFEDLLPNPATIHINSNEFIQNLIEYFKLILNILRKETYGRTKHITLIALTDILGGYLQHTVLPIARFSFYSGLINYETIDVLMRFFNEIKLFLRTNGDGWIMNTQQQEECEKINDNTEIEAIRFDDSDEDDIDIDYCHDLIIFNDEKNLTIPLPFFDLNEHPTSIALPLKTQPLHNLFIKKSSDLLMKFFIKSIKCLQDKHVNLYRFEQIKDEWLYWLEQEVIPKLDDPVLYTAFGGILRVQYTLKHIGTINVRQQQQKTKSIRLLEHQNIVFIVILTLLFICFLLGLLFICYKLRVIRKNRILKNQCHPKCPGSDNKSTITITTTTTTKSSKYFFPESTKCSCCKSDAPVNDSHHHHDQNPDKKRNKQHAIVDSTHSEKKLPKYEDTSEITSKPPKKKHRLSLFGFSRGQRQSNKSCCESCKCAALDFTTSDSSLLTDEGGNNDNNEEDVGTDDKNVPDVKTTSGESDYDEEQKVDNPEGQ